MRSGIAIATIGLSLGCASLVPTRPNTPYQGPGYPTNYRELTRNNPLLAEEIGKLPEIQDEISPTETISLEKLVKLYKKNPNSFDHAFEQMYAVGKPQVRKYCSPLQAFFWLFEDGNIDIAEELISDYGLNKLLQYSYTHRDDELEKSRWLRREAEELYKSCKDKELKEKIEVLMAKNIAATSYIIDLSKKNPAKFGYKFEENNYLVQMNREKKRWKNFQIVVHRLNSPELANYYVSNNFTFQMRWPVNAKQIFQVKGGYCMHFSMFVTYCLRKAGYNARNIQANLDDFIYTISVMRDDNNDYWIVMNYLTLGKILGPYRSYKEILKRAKLIREW